MFVDQAKITIRSGRGGDGHVSFRREKYVPAGGPDGGDGGRGGDIVFEVDDGKNTLADFRRKSKFAAEPGADGEKRNRHGKDGADAVLKVPPGTLIRDAASGKVIADMSAENRRRLVLPGGRGGWGNSHYATPSMQAPQYAQSGKPSVELEILLELKVIADVGLVGFPNAGKSTLLSRASNANPKIANYPFTTLRPNLGVADLDGENVFVIADIPGLVEGASQGAGLGREFLRHIERTKAIIHVVDVASTEGRDPISDIRAIQKELAAYDPALAKKPQLIAANKIDAICAGAEGDSVKRLCHELKGIPICPISAVTGEGVRELLYATRHLLQELDDEPIVFEQEFFPEEMVRGDEPYTVFYEEKTEEYVIEGPRVEKMLGYTNLGSEKGFAFFQRFFREQGIEDELQKLGIQDGDTVRMCDMLFDYYR